MPPWDNRATWDTGNRPTAVASTCAGEHHRARGGLSHDGRTCAHSSYRLGSHAVPLACSSCVAVAFPNRSGRSIDWHGWDGSWQTVMPKEQLDMLKPEYSPPPPPQPSPNTRACAQKCSRPSTPHLMCWRVACGALLIALLHVAAQVHYAVRGVPCARVVRDERRHLRARRRLVGALCPLLFTAFSYSPFGALMYLFIA